MATFFRLSSSWTLLATRWVFHLFWRLGPVAHSPGGLGARASYQSQNAAVLKRSRPRTSNTAIWVSRIIAGPYFSALLPRACNFLTFCCTKAWYNSVGFALWSLGGSIPRHHNLNLWLCKLLMYQRMQCCMSMTQLKKWDNILSENSLC